MDTREVNGWPVNEQGDVILRRGMGTKTITGFLPQSAIPVHESLGTVSYVDTSLHGDWTFIQDGRYTSVTPLVISNGSKVKLTFDFSNLAFSTGSGLQVGYNQSSNKFTPTNLNDVFSCNLRCKIIPTAQAGTVEVTVESPTVSFNPIVAETLTFNKSSGQEHFFSLFQPIFISQFLITNGVEIYIKPIGTNISVYDYSVFLQKTYSGINN